MPDPVVNGRRLAWLVACLPVVVGLGWSLAWASCAPEPEAWRLVWREAPLELDKANWADFTGQPNQLGFRLAHLGLLHGLGLGFAALALGSWLLAAGCVAAVVVLARTTLRGGGPGWLAPTALACLTAVWFSPGFGAHWLLAERGRVAVPTACLLAAMGLLLHGRRGFALRLAAAAALAQLALWTHDSGVVVWAALVPLVVHQLRRRQAPVLAVTGLWCLLGNAAGLACYDESFTADGGLLHGLLTQPWTTLGFWFQVTGITLADPTPDWPIAARALGCGQLAALAAATWCWRRRDAATLRAGLPWLTLAWFGAATTVVVVHRYFPPAMPNDLLRELLWPGLCLPIGLTGVAYVLAPATVVKLAPMLLGALLVLLGQQWQRGTQQLELEHDLLRQGEALLAFAGQPDVVLGAPLPLDRSSAQRARADGLLPGIVAVDSVELDQLGLARVEADGLGRLEAVVERSAAGFIVAQGARLQVDAVLLVRRSASAAPRIFGVAVPGLLGHSPTPRYTLEFGAAAAFAPGEEVLAFALDTRQRAIALLSGCFRFDGARFVTAKEQS